jgi:hypothetical protein
MRDWMAAYTISAAKESSEKYMSILPFFLWSPLWPHGGSAESRIQFCS